MDLVKFPDEGLTTPCKEVTDFDDSLQKLISGMRVVMKMNGGIGLAANQVGDDRRVIVVSNDKQESYYINPMVIGKSGSQMCAEGCLSFPGVTKMIRRPQYLMVRFQTITGEINEITTSGMLANILAHEIDHLNGIVFTEINDE